MKYVALTIGPIVKTLLKGKKTKEIWAASYLFSYIMREIIRALKDDHRIIVPSIDENLFDVTLKFRDKHYLGAGFFHDRLLFEALDRDKERVEKIINETLDKLASFISQHFVKLLPIYRNQMKNVDEADSIKYFQTKIDALKLAIETEDKIGGYLQEYFQIYYFEKEAGNIIVELSPYLDMLELQGKVIPQESIDYLLLFMENINHSFLKEDAFGIEGGGFESLPYIATRELHKLIDHQRLNEIFVEEMDDGKIYDTLEKELQTELQSQLNAVMTEEQKKVLIKRYKLKSYHKYIAIVQADGDNIGAIIQELQTFDEFSSKLLNFAKKSNVTIQEYGGSVVYAGGDDLLFFAPVVSDTRHIFLLLEQLREIFNEIFAEDIKKLRENQSEKIPSISFGLSIGYYKHPLDQALKTAYSNLEHKAKKIGTKGNISLKVLQHSGQYIETTINQSSSSYAEFKELTKALLAIEDEKDVLNAFHHTIRKFEDVLMAIYDDPKAIKNLFDNNFNEAHQDKYRYFTDILVAYIIIIFAEEQSVDDGIRRVYTTLKLMKFLKGSEA